MVVENYDTKVKECRRITFILALLFGIISLIGTEMPWLHITEDSGAIHSWNFLSTTNSTLICDHECSNSNDNSVSTTSDSFSLILTSTYSIEIFLSLYKVEVCQNFLSGYLPDSNSYINLNNFETNNNDYLSLCSVMDYNLVSKYLVNQSQWSPYEKYCKNTGTATVILIIISLSIMLLVTLIDIFTVCTDKCCVSLHKSNIIRVRSNSDHHNNNIISGTSDLDTEINTGYHRQHPVLKWFLPIMSFLLGPFCISTAIFIYYFECISVTTPEIDTNNIDATQAVLDASTGYRGFYMGMVTCILELIWWISFTIGICCRPDISDLNDIEFQEFKAEATNNKNKKNKNNNNINRPISTLSDNGEAGKNVNGKRSIWNKSGHQSLPEKSVSHSDNKQSRSRSNSVELQAPNPTDNGITSGNTAWGDGHNTAGGYGGDGSWINDA